MPSQTWKRSHPHLASFLDATAGSLGLFAGYIVLTLLLIGARPALAADPEWRFLGPHDFGSRVLSLAVDPTDPNRAFAGSASGGLWVSEDPATAGWTHVDTGHPVIGVGAIAAHPRDPSLVYVGTGEVYGFERTRRGYDDRNTRGTYGIGILKTTDGFRADGAWTKSLDWQPSEKRGVQNLAIVPEPGGGERFTVWAATSGGVYRLRTTLGAAKAATGEEHWQLVLPVVAAESVAPHPHHPDEVVVGVGNFGSPGHGLYKTTDGGATWRKLVRGTPVRFGGKPVIARSPSHPDVLYAAIGNPYDLIYSNAGVVDTDSSKEPAGTPDPKNAYKCLYAPTPRVEKSNWLLRSNDGGESWITQNDEINFAESQGWYALALAVHPREPDRIWLAGEAVYHSYDGGETLLSNFQAPHLLSQAIYDQTNPSLIYVDFHQILYAPGHPDILYLVCDQGVYRSEDGGRSVVRVNRGLDLMQFYRGVSGSPNDPDFLAGNAQEYGPGFLLYGGTEDGRGQWKIEVGYGYEGGYTAFDPKRKILYVGQHFQTRVSRWQKDADKEHPQIDQPDANEGGPCFIPDVDPFARSHNCLYNAAWNAPLVIAPKSGEVLYAARDVLYKSSPVPNYKGESKTCSNRAPGATWTPTSLGADLDGDPIMALAVSPRDDDHLVIATGVRYTGRMNVYESHDGGASYERITGDLPARAEPMSLRFSADAKSLYLALGGYGISNLWRCELGGGSALGDGSVWQDLDGGRLPDVWTSDIFVDPAASSHVYAATDWGVYRTTDGGQSWTRFGAGLYTAVESLEFLFYEKERLLRLVTHGNGIWEIALPAP